MKTCSCCQVEKSFSEFRKQTDSRDGHGSYCRSCANEKHKQWCRDNPETRKRHHRESWARHGAKKAPRARARYHEFVAKKGREKFKAQSKREYARKKATVPGYYAAKRAARRAAILRATPPWADKLAIAAIYAEAARQGKHVDHIVPLIGKTVCGLHVPLNLQLLTPTENKQKGNKFEFN